MRILTCFSLVLVLGNALCFKIAKNGIGTRHISVPVKQHETKDIKFPYQVGILLFDQDYEESWCGGSLIGNEWVLTSAHCVDGIEEAKVYLGSKHRQYPKFAYKVKKGNFIIHPDWDSENIENDIALIRIPYTRYSEQIRPVQLKAINETEYTYLEDYVITSGWGHITDSSLGLSNELDWSLMNVMKNDNCRPYFGWVVKPTNICIWTYGMASNCIGDSGGPLVLESSMTQIGVSSFGSNKGCEKGIPTVFTRVSPYLEWIESRTGITIE